jgi:putative transposase
MSRAKQLAFVLRTHGGRRKGAGRKPNGEKALVSHLARPRFDKVMPAHVTLRVSNDVPSLRSSRRFAIIRESFAASRGKFGLRLVEFSVQSNHLHLVVEADSSVELSRGMQGLCIRLAKALNRLMKRTGAIFSDHYHSHLLRSPTEVANAITYVLGNAAHHYRDEGPDWFSSAAPGGKVDLVLPSGWLLAVGWKQRGGRKRDGS